VSAEDLRGAGATLAEAWESWWLLWWLTVPAYVVVQIIVLVRASGFSRWVAALPLVVMIPAYVLFVIGLFIGGDNNLAPVLLILPSPIALLYVLVVAFVMPSAAKPSP
jgi:hypothetical protein